MHLAGLREQGWEVLKGLLPPPPSPDGFIPVRLACSVALVFK